MKAITKHQRKVNYTVMINFRYYAEPKKKYFPNKLICIHMLMSVEYYDVA